MATYGNIGHLFIPTSGHTILITQKGGKKQFLNVHLINAFCEVFIAFLSGKLTAFARSYHDGDYVNVLIKRSAKNPPSTKC